MPYYPASVRLTGIDISTAVLAQASARANALGVDIHLRLGDAQRLPFGDSSFDAVVCTLSLCSIPDHVAAIEEADASGPERRS
jgi:ubiquinone/menaquinone biosynthesis C-methylase UbiE